MKRSVRNIIEEAKSKLGGHVALYSYHLMNLVIKVDPVSLLGVNVKTEEGDATIERVADVFKTDDFHFAVVPKQQEYIVDLGKGILEVHPEFKQEVKNIKELMEEEADIDDDETYLFILLSMPEVNDDRYKVLKDGVNAYSDAIEKKVKTVFDFYNLKVETHVAPLSQEEKDEAKAAMEELDEMAGKTINEFKERKLKEIEEAYQKYLVEQAEKENERQNEEKAHGKTAGMSMKMLGTEDDE